LHHTLESSSSGLTHLGGVDSAIVEAASVVAGVCGGKECGKGNDGGFRELHVDVRFVLVEYQTSVFGKCALVL